MAQRHVRGRSCIFRDKVGGVRVQGLLTPRGAQAFEKHRRNIARSIGRDAAHVSDADVIEALARGEREAADYMRDAGLT